MDKNRTFVGKVNGKVYDSIEDYNQAFLDAIGKGGMVTASIEFKPEDNVQGKQEHVYDHCIPDFDLDELTGAAETDAPIIDNFIKQDLSDQRLEDIRARADKMNATDRAELATDVDDMIEGIESDIEDNNRSHTTLLKDMANNEMEINEIQAKLDALKENKNKIQTKINITEGADRVLRSSLEFYNALYENLNSRRRTKDSRIKTSGRVVERGNPGFVLDHDQKEVARRLFREIFGI